MVKKKDYQDILDCIKSDQVSAPEIAKYFKDKGFYKYWKKKQNEGVYGQQEQEELNASYKQSLANKKEREKK